MFVYACLVVMYYVLTKTERIAVSMKKKAFSFVLVFIVAVISVLATLVVHAETPYCNHGRATLYGTHPRQYYTNITATGHRKWECAQLYCPDCHNIIDGIPRIVYEGEHTDLFKWQNGHKIHYCPCGYQIRVEHVYPAKNRKTEQIGYRMNSAQCAVYNKITDKCDCGHIQTTTTYVGIKNHYRINGYCIYCHTNN